MMEGGLSEVGLEVVSTIGGCVWLITPGVN